MKSNKIYIEDSEPIQNKPEDDDEPIFNSNNNIKNSKKTKKESKISLKKITFSNIMLIVGILILVFLLISYLIIYFQTSKSIKLLNLKYQSIENPLNKENNTNEVKYLNESFDLNITKDNENENEKKEVKESKKEKAINMNKDRIGVAFVSKHIFGNGIGRMLSILCSDLAKLDKYDIYLITGQGYSLDFKFDERVKKVRIAGNKTLIENFDKTSNIKIYVLQNDLTPQNINWYKSLNGGKKVIGIMHGVYMSSIYSNQTGVYKIWKSNKLFDAYIEVIADDYYVNEKLGINNSFFIPNMYTFDADKTPNSNLTYKNLMIMGRELDKIKGGLYGIKAMKLIVEKIPDAKLYFISSNYKIDFLSNLINELDLTKNIEILHYTPNVTHYFLNSSILLCPSLSESFPMVMNEGKAHGLPIVAFNISYSPPYQNGVTVCEILNYTQMAEESIKLLENYEYRKKKGIEAKESLKYFSNKDIIDKWDRLFKVLISEDINEYKKLQKYTYEKYYDEEKARDHLETNFNKGKIYNPYFCCHDFNDMLNITYINNIQGCKNQSLCKK